jgi:hypothetical protein
MTYTPDGVLSLAYARETAGDVIDAPEETVGEDEVRDAYMFYGNPPNQTLQSAANDYIAQTRG